MPNYDEKTGISYGVISPHALNPDALSDIYTSGTDPHYESYKDELRARVDNGEIPIEVMEDELENFESCGDDQCDYSDKEYTLHISGDNFGIFVIKSPYYTYCRKCSPCAPGAGDLDAPSDVTVHEDGEHETSGDMAYCLDSSFFDEGKAPYRVFRVDNDQEVI